VEGGAASGDSGLQGVALETGAPNAASISSVFSANPKIAAAFGASPTIFAMAELGGETVGRQLKTTTSEIDETVDLTKLASRQDLVIGLYGGAIAGSDVRNITFDLYADGKDVIHQTFSSPSAAKAYFTDNAIDLGSLVVGHPLGSNTLTLRAVMSVTSGSQLTGFSGGLIIGDPPAASHASAHPRFVEAMAGFGGGQAASAAASPAAHRGAMAAMLAAPGLVHAVWA
jgi:hypothetical protein